MKTSLLLKSVVVATLVFAFHSAAFAQDGGDSGGSDSGGGNAHGNMLLDFYENAGTKPFDVERSSDWINGVLPAFAAIDAKVPGFSAKLKEGLHQKIWLLEPKPLEAKECIDKSIFRVKKTIIACQNSREIRLSKSWMDGKIVDPETKKVMNVDLKNRAGLIVHELVRYQALISNDISDQDIMFTVRTVFDASALPEDDIKKALSNANMGYWPTATQTARAHQLEREVVMPLCNGVTEKTAFEVENKLRDLYEKMVEADGVFYVINEDEIKLFDIERAQGLFLKAPSIQRSLAVCNALNRISK